MKVTAVSTVNLQRTDLARQMWLIDFDNLQKFWMNSEQ